MNQYVEQLVDLTDLHANHFYNMTLEDARQRLLLGSPEAVREIDGSFALVVKKCRSVKMARSLDRPLRYFLAKREEGPALVVANRIDVIRDWLRTEGFGEQFHPSYTRMVPAHHVVEIQLVGCPDPDPAYTRFFSPDRNRFDPTHLDEMARQYIGAAANEIRKWLEAIPSEEPIGVCFSGGIDSGAVFLLTYHLLLKMGCNPSRLKAFTLTFGEGQDLQQARSFLKSLDLELFLEPIAANLVSVSYEETIRVVEDYKALDIESAAMAMTLCRGIRAAYPDWKYLIDGDGGDENLKDYPIDENPELTIRSVVNNRMLYQEGWGLGTMKHSLTYSGGLSRSYVRTYAPGRHFKFEGFSPFTRPAVIEVAEGIPFIALTEYDVARLYALKGDLVQRGIKHVTGFDMPVHPKRRFQHGALNQADLSRHRPTQESQYRKEFLASYS